MAKFGLYFTVISLQTCYLIVRLDKYAISKFAESFEFVPKTLADNAGLNAMEITASLYTGHGSGNAKLGINLEEGVCKDVSHTKVWDLYSTK